MPNVAPMKKLSVDRVAEQLRAHEGNLAAVGRAFGVTRTAVSLYVTRHPELIAVRDEARESMKDDAESVLYRQVKEGEAWAVCFFLKTQAKDRGYIERTEVEQTTNARLVIEEDVVGDDNPPGETAPGAG